MTAKLKITGNVAREAICKRVWDAQEGTFVVFKDGDRTLEQNALFHTLCGLAAKTLIFAGKPRTLGQWKVLFVSGHASATGNNPEVVAGLEGEYVNIRESTAQMGIRRMNSLIEYTLAYLSSQGVEP